MASAKSATTSKPGCCCNQPANAARKETLLREARELFQEADRELTKAVEDLEARLTTYPKFIDPKLQAPLFQHRQRSREGYLESRMAQAAVPQEAALAYDANSAEWKQRLELAIARYDQILERWRSWVIGLVALREVGRCRQELGQRKVAIACYLELLALDDDESILELRGTTLALAMQCWRQPDENNAAEGIKLAREWLEVPWHRRNTRVMLAIRWELALALEDQGRRATKGDERSKLFGEARVEAQQVLQSLASDHRPDALALLKRLSTEESAARK